jgi:hypothetical protein
MRSNAQKEENIIRGSIPRSNNPLYILYTEQAGVNHLVNTEKQGFSAAAIYFTRKKAPFAFFTRRVKRWRPQPDSNRCRKLEKLVS